MRTVRTVSLAALLALSACAVPTLQQRKVLDSMVGKSEVDVLRQFGVPTRNYQASGHEFLAYIDNQTQYSPGGGMGGWGWGWGGGGWGGGWGGGFGGPWGGGFGGPWGGGFGGYPSTYYNTSCQTTFEIVGGQVVGWTMRGDGC
ncbi:hypothetical protein [Gluconobacter wancherniae]|uniref:Lipoprotein n=1 Tax=Gluconobacter wancherniae NBRC 103581 TaxID=656744 RepID=A0A511B1N2_9PROT|nr:hypothetical protein [Gluconobacter wancherniae]MBF0853813.1 hypothetical protein [Gluconobacter wancherniae]GBD56868.1 hypothetical protein NBRC103581_01450 [Gluconobacter wancherniae NBRC 103581]GBR64723.1 hypothetical protein AA103581_1461 [Gluconobacter wancherniae NBRC 103581]GEK94365.1 hypothetical protein GWA01_21350 [Gluconobacter wancherniae NBRC 103581]